GEFFSVTHVFDAARVLGPSFVRGAAPPAGIENELAAVVDAEHVGNGVGIKAEINFRAPRQCADVPAVDGHAVTASGSVLPAAAFSQFLFAFLNLADFDDVAALGKRGAIVIFDA